jgi:hypothetical protein
VLLYLESALWWLLSTASCMKHILCSYDCQQLAYKVSVLTYNSVTDDMKEQQRDRFYRAVPIPPR